MFGQNLKNIRNIKKMTMDEVVSKINKKYEGIIHINKGNLSKWENNKSEPMLSTVNILADFYGICIDDLVSGNFYNENIQDIIEVYNKLEPPRQTKVYNFAESELKEQHYVEEQTDEILGLAAAGEPIDGQQPVPLVGVETVKLLVNGDSMEPKYSTGDVIEYQPQPELENGELGVFAVNGGVTIKRFRRNGDVRLGSLNKKYDDIIIKETDDFNILGKVL
jgi:SOS-response transcriptional repressor LexA